MGNKPSEVRNIVSDFIEVYDPHNGYKPIEEFINKLEALVAEKDAEVKRLRGDGLKEYSWWISYGVYCGGFDFKVVAESLEQAREYAKKYLKDNEIVDVMKNEPDDISQVSPKLSGYYEYHMDAGG